MKPIIYIPYDESFIDENDPFYADDVKMLEKLRKVEHQLWLVPYVKDGKNGFRFELESNGFMTSRCFHDKITGLKCPRHENKVLPVILTFDISKGHLEELMTKLTQAWENGNLKNEVKRWNENIQ